MSASPNLVVFACNWDGLTCLEAAGQQGLGYPTWVRVVRVNCLSRINLGLILKALDLGADGVVLLGCQPGQCHYDIGSTCIQEEYRRAQEVFKLLGIEEERLVLVLVAPGDAESFVAAVNGLAGRLQTARPGIGATRTG